MGIRTEPPAVVGVLSSCMCCGPQQAQISAVFWSPGRTYSLLSTGSKEHSPDASSGIIFMLNFVLVLRRNDT